MVIVEARSSKGGHASETDRSVVHCFFYLRLLAWNWHERGYSADVECDVTPLLILQSVANFLVSWCQSFLSDRNGLLIAMFLLNGSILATSTLY